mmetsp:Transcript_25774/g.34301  ORF Transcript_25774/g.34301 Transcript_25774/m.34301 type:complete len:390 (-) Transcript_25774:279-1448(-)
MLMLYKTIFQCLSLFVTEHLFSAAQQNNQNQQNQNQQQKHDIFVGNLAFSTTEEQLIQAFSELGRLVKVRMVKDLETGKPRGFAFIEFEDPQAALSAIRNMNDYELNGRRIRVNFSNSSHLETLAGELGMDMSHANSQRQASRDAAAAKEDKSGTQAVAESLKTLTKGEMYDVVAKLKEIADTDPDEARRLLCSHPQLPEAILHLMSKLDMIKQPPPSSGLDPTAAGMTGGMGVGMGLPPPPPDVPPGVPTAPPPQPPPPSTMRASDPRAARSDPRAALSDPRAAVARVDPRTARNQPPPPIPPPPGAGLAGMPPPPPNMAQPPPPHPPPPHQFMQPPPPQGQQQPGVANLDPGLVQQVMSLTPQQISQLPPDKQQSILALRQQITGGR